MHVYYNNRVDENVFTIVRAMPIHNGHKEFLVKLCRRFKKVIIAIGSCYENGTERNCIPAVEREKMIRAVLKAANIPEEKYEITTVSDFPTFEQWIDSVVRLCKKENVTHFCTGNKEDILDVLEKRGETLNFEMINPEEDSTFPYHATDIRKLIIEGNYEKLSELIPSEIKPILFKYSFKEIIAASEKKGIHFIPGRQAVDVVFLIKNTTDGKIYALLGKRAMEKKDFPGALALPGGGIDEFETAINAAVREFKEETGLEIKILDNSLEPAIIKFANVKDANLEQMYFVGIYSSEDEALAGTQGGSSQCFGIFVEDNIEKYQEVLAPTSDLTDIGFVEVREALSKGLAFQQTEMLEKALMMFEAYPMLKK